MPSFVSKNSVFYFSIIFTSLMLLDVVSTKIALTQGHNEQNPIMQGIVDNTILFVVLKLSISGVIIFMIKKCIEQDRKIAINGMRILTAFMMLVVLGNFITVIGGAESGILSLDEGTENSYTSTAWSGGAAANTNFSYIKFANTSYNMISKIEVWGGGITCTCQSLSVPFTISSGGTGSGIITYSSTTGHIIYYFTNTSITRSPIILSFSGELTGLSGGKSATASSAPTSTTPVYIDTTWPSSNHAESYIVQTGLSLTNNYNYTSSLGGIYTIYINKTPATVQTKILIKNTTGAYYFTESTFNTNSFNNSDIISDGVIINMSVASGASTQITIGATPPELRTYPTIGANIYTDNASYVVGDNIDVEWFIADDPYNNLLSSCEFIVNDEIIAQSINQHDNYTLIKPTIGVKKLQIGCGVFSNTIAGEKSVQVIAESQSYITIQNGTAKAGSLNNFTYKWGFTPSSYRWLNIYKFDVVRNTWVKESSNSIQTASTANVIYTSSALIKSDGKYYAEICDNNRRCPTAKALFTSVYEANVPIYYYGFSNISVLNQQATYAQNDWLEFNTRIDGTNFSSGKSFSVRLYNPATTTTKTLQYIHNENENNIVYLDSAMESGAQKLELVGTNLTGTYILNQTDITTSLLDASGFGLYTNKYNNVCPKESVLITAISPQNSTLTISVAPIRRYNFTGSKTVEIRGLSDYTVSLDTDGIQNKLISIFINSSCVLNPVEVPGTPSTVQTMNNLVSFLSLPAFWGILIFAFVVIAVAWKAPAAVGIVALIISNLEAILGLWSPYTIYVFIVTWIIAAIYFTIGRNTTTGGNP